MTASAQLSKNPDKFLGNITTSYRVNAGGGVPNYNKLWNQITPENESKWGSVEGSRGNFNWGCDTPFNAALQYGFPFKFHAFLWGAQYPGFIDNLSIKERYEAFIEWLDAIQKHYSDTKWNPLAQKFNSPLPMVDVVNEAIGMHQKGNPIVKTCTGGGGKTGYDWLIKAFELAYERFPGSILIYNDFNSIRWDVGEYRKLVQALRDAGAPIDAYGNQSHDVDDIKVSELKTSLKETQDLLKMPMYITELDINVANDNTQRDQYKALLPVMWEADYCAGVTLWGYVFGNTWVSNSGLYKSGEERPAMTWIKEYMATDKAKNAKSPFPGMKKEASIYIKPADFNVAKGDVVPVKVRVRMATKKVEKVELFAGNSVATATTLVATMTEAPYICEYTAPTSTGYKVFKAVVTTPDTTYVRYGGITVLNSTIKRQPYNETPFEMPGTINVAEYDKGASGVTYKSPCFSYSNRKTQSATQDNAWMEYTVDVKEEGLYKVEAEVASVKEGGTFHLTEYGLDSLTFLANMIEVPVTGSTTEYKTVTAAFKNPISVGQHRICLNVDKGGFFIKKLTFKPYKLDKNIKVSVSSVSASTITVGGKSTVKLSASHSGSTIDSVLVYANGSFIAKLTEAPYTVDFEPTAKGSYTITAVAWSGGYENETTTVKTVKVNGVREPYADIVELPGIIEAENFDKGGEGLSFHDKDDVDEGDAKYRTDNEGVDIVKGNGGSALGYTAVDEWFEYTVNVAQAGKFTCVATVSAGGDNSKFTISRKTLTGSSSTLWTVNVPKTGENTWSNYTQVELTTPKQFPAGKQYIRIKITGANCNIDKLEFKSLEETGIDDVQSDLTTPWGTSYDYYSLSGQKVNGNYRGIVIRNGKKILKK